LARKGIQKPPNDIHGMAMRGSGALSGLWSTPSTANLLSKTAALTFL